MTRLVGEFYQYQHGTIEELKVMRMFMMEKHDLTGKIYGNKQIESVTQNSNVPGNCWLFELSNASVSAP